MTPADELIAALKSVTVADELRRLVSIAAAMAGDVATVQITDEARRLAELRAAYKTHKAELRSAERFRRRCEYSRAMHHQRCADDAARRIDQLEARGSCDTMRREAER